MCRKRGFVLLVILLASGCGKESTGQLLEKLKSSDRLTRIKAVRTLPERRGDAMRIIPALIDALKDEDADVRKGAAFGLGSFGEQARDAIPALQANLRDRETSVRKAAGVALTHIDPTAPRPGKATRGK